MKDMRYIVLDNYSIYREVLKIDLRTNQYCITQRDEAVPLTSGWFGRFGEVTARISSNKSQPEQILFELFINRKTFYSVAYQPNLVLGANPYDNEPEDVDFCYMIVRAVERKQFFETYTKSQCYVKK